MRVFEAKERRAGRMQVSLEHVLLDHLWIDGAPLGRKGPTHDSSNERGGSDFVVQDVRLFLDKDCIARLTVRGERNLVSHCPAWDEERCPLSCHFCGKCLQLHDGWLVAQNVVSQRSRLHRIIHFRCGPGYGVATKIDHVAGFRRKAGRVHLLPMMAPVLCSGAHEEASAFARTLSQIAAYQEQFQAHST